MSLTILLGKTPYPLASAEGWRRVGQWVESLDVPLEHLERLCARGMTDDTEQLEYEVREAISQRPPAPVRDTLAGLASSIAGGAPDETAQVMGAGEEAPMTNAFCPTGPGGGQVNTCPPANAGGVQAATGVPVHAGSGLPVGHWFTKRYGGSTHTVQITSSGIQVTSQIPSSPSNPVTVKTYPSLTAAAKGVRGNNTSVNGWVFFGQSRPAASAPPAPAPTPAPTPPPPPAPPPVPPPTPHPPAPPAPAPTPQAPTGALHPSGLKVGATYTKSFRGNVYTVEVGTSRFKVVSSNGSFSYHNSLTAAAMAVRGNNTAVNGWKFFGIAKPAGSSTPAPASPTPSPRMPASTVTEKVWKTGQAEGTELNGIPFDKAPYKFWEHVKDVDVKEPPAGRHIERALVMIQEPDGRLWIVRPTNEYGGRKYTIPGGTVEKGLTLQQNALKEAWEETGLKVEITRHLGDIEDSNNGRIGRLYLARRVGGSPWEPKVESNIINNKTGKPDAENESVHLVTPERAMQLLHRTDDQAMLATVVPIPLKTKTDGNLMKKLVDGIQPAAKQYAKDQRTANRHIGNAELHAVQELRGFNNVPTVVSKNDMDALVKAGTHIEMLRGVTRAGNLGSAALVAQFKTGNHFPGSGCFGSGSYFDAGKGSRNVAVSQYGASGDVIRAALPKTAKIIDQSELERIAPHPPSNSTGENGSHSQREGWWGTHAALAGYDAIHVDGNSPTHGTYGSLKGYDGKDFYVILNRSILTVQQDSAKGHRIK